jgi:hypothetical protein
MPDKPVGLIRLKLIGLDMASLASVSGSRSAV